MNNNGLRWARCCLVVTLTLLLSLSSLMPAFSARRSRVRGDTTASHAAGKRKARTSRSSQTYSKQKVARSSGRSRSASRRAQHTGPVITGQGVSLRAGVGTGCRRITLLEKGTRVRVIGKRNGWLRVRLPNGRTGWTRADFVAGSHRIERESRVSSSRRRRSLRGERGHVARRPDAAQNRRGTRFSRYTPEPDAPIPTRDIVRTAYAYRGTPYRYGGSSRGGFDCSGFTSFLYRQKGIQLPHSASAQFHRGRKVSLEELQPGDLVFFSTVRRGISHVGMYVGDGKFVHASSRRRGGVRVDRLDTGYYRERFRGARRYTD